MHIGSLKKEFGSIPFDFPENGFCLVYTLAIVPNEFISAYFSVLTVLSIGFS